MNEGRHASCVEVSTENSTKSSIKPILEKRSPWTPPKLRVFPVEQAGNGTFSNLDAVGGLS